VTRNEIGPGELAAALVIRSGAPTGRVGRLIAVQQAQRILERIPDGAVVDRELLSRASHAALCPGTSAFTWHDWEGHAGASDELLELLALPDLMERVRRA
jgi:hypothetical protein